MDPQPIQIIVYDKSMNFKGHLALPNAVTVTPRFNAPAECVFQVDADVPRIADLTADGARAVVRYRWREDQPYQTLVSGTVHEVSGSGPANEAVRELSVRDDFWLFTDMLAWPVPTAALSAQTDTNYKLSGPAETVIRTVTDLAADRLGEPLTVEADAARGTTIRVNARFAKLSDLFFQSESEETKSVGTGGLGVRIVQEGGQRLLRFWEPGTYPRTLTEASGIVQDGTFTITAPTVTRVIVGGGGQGKERNFRQYTDAAAEAAFGFKREVFVDARDVQPMTDDEPPVVNPNFEAELQARGDEALAEGRGTAGLDITLSESDVFKFGNAFGLGDTVTVDISGSGPLTATVSEVEISWQPGEGLLVTPRVGAWDSSADAQLIRVVSKTAKALRALQRNY